MSRNELDFVRDMFDRIAPHYDFLNRLLSLRQDVYWRKTMVSNLDLNIDADVLDIACGTADVCLEIQRQLGCDIQVAGVDFSPEMLRLAKHKIEKMSYDPKIALAAGDVFDLPFKPESFDAVTMAFGIRNIQDKTAALKCLLDLLKPGGRLAVLELSIPPKGIARYAYLSYFNKLLPFIGRFFSKHHFAYSYLPTSVSRFPEAAEFAKMMYRVGFRQVRYQLLTSGVTVLFIGDKR